MKRDMELVREMLVLVEAKLSLKPEILKIESRDEAVVARHVELLVEAGFLEAVRHRNGRGGRDDYFVVDLT